MRTENGVGPKMNILLREEEEVGVGVVGLEWVVKKNEVKIEKGNWSGRM